MAMSEASVRALAQKLYAQRVGERSKLDTVRRYWKGRQRLPAVIPTTAPREVSVMARIARVNVCAIVVDSLAQSTFVDGFRGRNDDDDLEVWQAWQANRLDGRQTGLHRAVYAYGVGYSIALPGDPFPVIRRASPRALTAVYGDDEDWPVHALEKLAGGSWRLYDDQAVYFLRDRGDGKFDLVDTKLHKARVTPVVRYFDEDDLDREDEPPADGRLYVDGVDVDPQGQIAPLISVQDQIDMTTFGLLSAQWYTAFRQRWAIGWTPENADDKKKAAASQLWTFDANPDDMKLGEFSETTLEGYIKSREASLRHAATLSQTPVHELIGELVNLSAEALTAAEQGHERKVAERKALLGEAHEQMLSLVGDYMGVEVPDDAQVVWRDTSARAYSATIDALGKLVTMLGVPAQEVWELIPGVSKQDVERWKVEAESGDALARLERIMAQQADQPSAPAPAE